MYRIGILFFILIFSASSALAETKKTIRLTFKECVERALEHNNQLKAADYDIELSKAKALQAHPKGVPVIKYEYRLAPVPEDIDDAAGSFFAGDISVLNALKVELGTAVYTFGRLSTAQDLADVGINASWYQKSKTTDEIVLKMYQVYEGIILARELLDLGKQARQALEQKINDLEKEDLKDQLQILKLRMALYEVLRKVEEAQKKEKMALLALRVQTGMGLDQPVEVRTGGLQRVSYGLKPVHHYLNVAAQKNSNVNLLNRAKEAKEKQLALEKKEYLPNLGVGAFLDIGRAPNIRGAQDENNFTNPFNYTKAGVGMQLKGDLDFIKTRSKVKQAEADLLKTIYQKKAAEEGIQLDVYKSYYDVMEASDLVAQVTEEKKAARQLVFLTKSNLDLGVGDRKDYTDALQSYLLFQGREFEAIYNYNVAVMELRVKTGEYYDQYVRKDNI